MKYNWLRRNYEKIMLFIYIYMFLHDFIARTMFFLDSMTIKGGSLFFLSLCVAFFIIFVYIQNYWITACLLLLFNRLMNITLLRSFKSGETLINRDNHLAIWITVVGILCLCVSLFYFYKFIRMKNYGDYYLLKDDNKS